MNVLVDTCAWLAYFRGDPSLGKMARRLLESPDTRGFVSLASTWEVAIKIHLGKLEVPFDVERDLPDLLRRAGLEILPIEIGDTLAVASLEDHHGDPFDRIQIVQARRRGLPVMTRDAVWDSYGLKRIW